MKKGIKMLIETIKNDQLSARKMRDTQKAVLLTTLYSEAAIIGKNDGNRDSTDEEVQKVVKKFINNARDVMNNLDDSDNRYDAAKYEVEVLEQYLPQQISDEELREAIVDLIETNNVQSMKDMGFIMTELKAYYPGQFDGSTASKIVRELLG
jgi:uncharacterized protein YqeY